MFVMFGSLWRTINKAIGIFEKIVDLADIELDNTIEVNKLGHAREIADEKKLLAAAKK